MSPQKRNVIVGLTVILGLSALVWMLLTFSGNAVGWIAKTGVTVSLTSERADGLSPGSLVFYRGVTVGRVINVVLLPDNQHVQIQVTVDANPPLPNNLIGLIRTSSALGSNAIISLDTIGAPSNQPLKTGDQLLARFVGLELIPPEFTALAGEVQQQELVHHFDQAVVSIRDQVNKAGVVLDSVDKLVADPKIQSELHDSIANLREASANAVAVTQKFNAISDKVDHVVDHADGRIDDLSRQIGTDGEKLGKVLDELDQTAQSLNSTKGTAGLLVNDPKLYNSLTDTVRTLHDTVADLKRVINEWEQEGVPLKLAK